MEAAWLWALCGYGYSVWATVTWLKLQLHTTPGQPLPLCCSLLLQAAFMLMVGGFLNPVL